MIDKKFVARHRLRFTLGSGIIGTFFFVINLLTFAKVWEETFNFYQVPIIIIYIGLPSLYIFSCWIVGYIYDVKGFWKEEASHANRELNPEFVDMMHDIKDIKKYMEEKK
jgi:hypothetical protein